MSGVQARCSHCAYVRRFSPELGGRYFRCPRCRQGVLAVPRPSAEEAQAWETSHVAWLEQSSRALAVQLAEEAQPPDACSGSGSGSGDQRMGSPDEAPQPFPFAGAGALRDGGAAPQAKPGPTSRRGEVAPARQLLVECGLCAFLVRIPPEFFGKTVHCPECAGATVFSESTLEPVKDELLDRLMLETREREVLFPPAETGRSRRQAVRWLLVGLGLGALIPGALLGVSALDRHWAHARRVTEAEQEGWRYALDTGALLIHEPWCTQLHHADKKIAASELDARLDQGYSLHECR